MANLLHATRFQSPNPAATSPFTFTVTIPATTAGSTLVCVAGGGAVIQAKLGVGGINFTKRTSSLSLREVVAQDIVDSGGGTTQIQFALNGTENIDGMIFEFASGSLGAFIAGNTEGGSGGNTTTDTEGHAKIGTVTTSGPAVLFMMFTAATGTQPSNQFWGVEPLAKQYVNVFNAPDPAHAQYWSLIALSDQAGAGTFNGQSSRTVTAQEHQSVMWAYTDNQPGTPTYANPYANYIAAENSLPGSLNSVWFGVTTNANIAGFTDAMSYAPGDTINFKVDSNNVGFTIEVTRLGYYGYASFGGRRLGLIITGTPAVQPAPTIDSYGGTVCAWSTTATWAIPAATTPGVYVYNMRRTDNSSFLAQGLFVIKNTTPAVHDATRMMVAMSDFTWQAYNVWGARTDAGAGNGGFTGRSLYGTAPAVLITGRAFAVSYDRPIGTISNNGDTYFWDSEGGLVNFLEGNGYFVDYYTSVDLEKDATIPPKYGIAVASGHCEYWTQNMRDAYENARDAGTHLIFLSSNTALWHTRFDPADTNKRKMICYKDSHNLTGWDNTTKFDPISYTGTWRDIRTNVGGVNNTNRRPESGMTGQWFVGNGQFEDNFAVANSYRTLPLWRNSRMANNLDIAVGSSSSGTLATAGTSISILQPTGTQVGDLIVVALVLNGVPGSFQANGARIVRTISDSTNQTTVIMVYYAVVAGTAASLWSWTNTRMASGVLMNYRNAIFNDSDFSIRVDTGGTAAHTTDSVIPASNDRWAVGVFADSDTTGTSKTTSWTAGAGLTSRVQINNAATGGPWNSVALMDSNGAVTQAAHQYSATAQFANPHASAGILYLTPGKTTLNKTIGFEWDYLKLEEPSTPKNIVRLSDQIFALEQKASDYNGDAYIENGLLRYGITLYKAASGALVFNTGTWRYQYGLSRFRHGAFDSTGNIDTAMQQSILNIICDMGITPTTLLGTTANNDATALVDPSPAATSADYGLTLTDPGYKTIFGTAVPSNTDNALGSDANLGTVFTASSNGQIFGVRWHFPETLPNQQVIGLLYSWTDDTHGAELARATAINVQTGWNNIPFSAPVNISANTKYVAAIWTFDRDVFTTGQLSSAVTNGPLTGVQDSAGTHNGKILTGNGSPAFPTGSGGGIGYLADVLFLGSGTVQFEGWGFPVS